jgi:hypothetical protein
MTSISCIGSNLKAESRHMLASLEEEVVVVAQPEVITAMTQATRLRFQPDLSVEFLEKCILFM